MRFILSSLRTSLFFTLFFLLCFSGQNCTDSSLVLPGAEDAEEIVDTNQAPQVTQIEIFFPSGSNNVDFGEQIDLSVVADPNLDESKIFWSKDGVPLSGMSGTTLSISNATTSEIGSYQALYEGISSNVLSVTVGAPAVLLKFPVGTTNPLVYASNTTLEIEADPLLDLTNAQWNFNGTPIPGAIGPTYQIDGAISTDAGTYSVTVDAFTSNDLIAVVGVARSCQQIKQTEPNKPTGDYQVDVDGSGGRAPFTAHCDMSTDGGGWMLVLNYLHQANTNPALSVRANSTPLLGSQVLGQNGSAQAASWGHANNALMTDIQFTETRFYCRSNGSARVVHVKSSAAGCRNYLKTGTGNCNSSVASHTALGGHNGVLPALHNQTYPNQGDLAMTRLPFSRADSAHWAIRAASSNPAIFLWDCDTDNGSTRIHTLHNVWVR